MNEELQWEPETDSYGFICEDPDCNDENDSPTLANWRFGPRENGRGWLCNKCVNASPIRHEIEKRP